MGLDGDLERNSSSTQRSGLLPPLCPEKFGALIPACLPRLTYVKWLALWSSQRHNPAMSGEIYLIPTLSRVLLLTVTCRPPAANRARDRSATTASYKPPQFFSHSLALPTIAPHDVAEPTHCRYAINIICEHWSPGELHRGTKLYIQVSASFIIKDSLRCEHIP